MKIAVVGPRKGADLEAVESFVTNLYEQSPEAILISGGAEGVDSKAETTWLALGGIVWSFRIRKTGSDKYETEKWELGTSQPKAYLLLNEPTWATPASALYYRSMIVAAEADRIVAFHGPMRMSGTEFTTWVAREGERKPTHVYTDGHWTSYNT